MRAGLELVAMIENKEGNRDRMVEALSLAAAARRSRLPESARIMVALARRLRFANDPASVEAGRSVPW